LAVEIEANGFLYNMVRNIVGSLVEVGRGAQPPQWIATIRDAADRTIAGPTAPPQGLFLMKVDY
jgi:tRNA pseudouridine38-40 synthase